MPGIKIDDDTGLPVIERGAPERTFQARRGRVLPPALPVFRQRGGMGQTVDADMIESGKKLLDEALGN